MFKYIGYDLSTFSGRRLRRPLRNRFDRDLSNPAPAAKTPWAQTGEGLDPVLNQPPSLKLRRAKEGRHQTSEVSGAALFERRSVSGFQLFTPRGGRRSGICLRSEAGSEQGARGQMSDDRGQRSETENHGGKARVDTCRLEAISSYNGRGRTEKSAEFSIYGRTK